MSDDDANNFNANVNHAPVTSGAGSSKKRRKHYGKPLAPIRRLPEAGSRARELVEDRICSLFRDGKDTMFIAGAVNLTEAIVYNVLAEAAE